MLQEGGHIRCLKQRLLKNHVVDRTGWRAYALFTAAALSHMEVCPEAMYESSQGLGHTLPGLGGGMARDNRRVRDEARARCFHPRPHHPRTVPAQAVL